MYGPSTTMEQIGVSWSQGVHTGAGEAVYDRWLLLDDRHSKEQKEIVYTL